MRAAGGLGGHDQYHHLLRHALCKLDEQERKWHPCLVFRKRRQPPAPLMPFLLLQLGGLVGLAVSLLYFLQEKIVSAAAAAVRMQALSSVPKLAAARCGCCQFACSRRPRPNANGIANTLLGWSGCAGMPFAVA